MTNESVGGSISTSDLSCIWADSAYFVRQLTPSFQLHRLPPVLTDPQISEIRAILESSRARILGSSRDATAFSRDRDKSRIGGDSIDLSAAESHYGTELVLADRDGLSLDQINKCLQRLEEGLLDTCEDCEEEIGFARLRARPMATLCVPCQEELESL